MPVDFSSRTCAPAVIALVMVAACGGDDTAPPSYPLPDASPADVVSPDRQPPPPPDKTPPTLMQRVPEDGDPNVWGGAPIVLVFSEPLAPSSVDEAAVTLQSPAGPVAKRTTLSDDGREIRVVIESPHIGPTDLTAMVANTVTDIAGNAFAGVSWSWTVPLWQRPGGEPVAAGVGPLRPSLALDAAQNPVVAWQDSSAGAPAIRVARLVDGRWQRLGDSLDVQAGAVASAPRVALMEFDEPVVVWQETSAEKHVFAARFRGARWERLGTGPIDAGAGREAGEPVLAIDTGDRPVVAWIQDKARVELRRWEGGGWKTVWSAWDAGFALSDLAMALDEVVPVLAVAVAGVRSTDVRVVRWPNFGTSWQLVGTALDRATDHAATRPSVAVSRDGAIGVAWQENDGFSDNVYAAGYDETKESWQLWAQALDVEFDASAVAPSLGFTPEGTPMVAWSEVHAVGPRTYVGRFNGTRWEVPGAGLDTPGSRSSTSAVVTLDLASNPVLVWEERVEAEAGAMSQVSARRYNGGLDLPFGLEARKPPPCSFPLDGAADFPRTLTETKCFTDVPRRVPAPGLIPYDINSPLWSDGAIKRRFIILPDGANIGYREKHGWQLPVGAILVKEFLFEREPGNPATLYPMETRFLVKRCESGLCRAAWEGYSYQWNDSATEATLLENTNQTLFKDWPSGARMHRHSYPGKTECSQCHVNVAGGILGLQTAQMNRNFDYGGAVDNQLRALYRAGVFGSGTSMDGGQAPDGSVPIDGSFPGDDGSASMDGGTSVDGGAPTVDASTIDGRSEKDGGAPPGSDFPFGSLDTLPRFPTPSDAAHTLNERVRSYFHSNCSHCHRPDGRWPVIDLMYDAPLISAKLPNANICNELTPGDPEISRLYIKDRTRLGSLPPDFFGLPMPPLASLLPDPRQLPTLRAWIEEMKTCP